MNMNIVRWRPFWEFGQGLDRNFQSELDALRQSDDAVNWKPPVDIHETEHGYRLDVELPAVDPEDVRVELHKGVLNISGERRFADEEDGNRMRLRERQRGKFRRSFRLPEDADADAIRATAKHGIVSITVGKSVENRRAIAVEAA